MKVGEIWRFNGLTTYSICNIPIDDKGYSEDEEEYFDLINGDCFIILEDLFPEHLKEFGVCVFFNNQKWYLEVSKYSVTHGLFKKI